MPRPQLHPPDAILDAARGLLLDRGGSSATIEAIAAASGAPTGSIYHNFGSRDELVARLWIRAARRSQAFFLEALDDEDPRRAALAAGLSIIEFAEREPADAQLLVTFRREDLMRAVGGELATELDQLNRPVERAVVALAKRLYGRASRRALDRILLATFDLPYGAVRRFLISGERIPRALRDDVTVAASAVLDSNHAA